MHGAQQELHYFQKGENDMREQMKLKMKIRLALQLQYYRILFLLGLKSEEIYYIGGSEALPPPLTRDEEEYLLGKLSSGDAAVRSMLIERNLRLVVYIARKFENTGINIEDLVSIGAIGLIKAVNTFDPEKKIKLATYASRCIENEILMYLRRNSKTRTEVSFDEPLNIDWDGNELLLSDVMGTENDTIYRNIEEQVDRKLLHKALDKLTDRERLIMELRFGLQDGEEKTQKDVADLLGISQSYISRLEKRIIKRLRKEFNKMV
jgi:RNA polymerase sporulation-specific sigma factor